MARWAVRLLALVVAIYAGFLAEAHFEMQLTRAELPSREQILAVSGGDAGPVRLRFINSGTQLRPEGRRGTYGGFLLEWADGRAFAIDLGMTKPVARDFGKTMEWLGAQPVEVFGSMAEVLGADAAKIAAVGFSHMHYDHTDGIIPLCQGRSEKLPVYQVPDQYQRGNFGTRAGRADVDKAGCAVRKKLQDGPLYEIPGFPGLAAFAVGGHTPGSTAFVAKIGETHWLFAGDVANDFENLRNNIPKPLAYSLLLIPENRQRLEWLRRWLGELDLEEDVTVVVAHDLDRIAEVGIEIVPK